MLNAVFSNLKLIAGAQLYSLIEETNVSACLKDVPGRTQSGVLREVAGEVAGARSGEMDGQSS